MSTTGSIVEVSDYLGKKILKKIRADDFCRLSPESRLKRIDKYLKKIIEEEKIIISRKEIHRLSREIHKTVLALGRSAF